MEEEQRWVQRIRGVPENRGRWFEDHFVWKWKRKKRVGSRNRWVEVRVWKE